MPEVDALLAPSSAVSLRSMLSQPMAAIPPGASMLRAMATSAPPSTKSLRQKDWPVRELRRDVRTLEDVFNSLVTTAQ